MKKNRDQRKKKLAGEDKVVEAVTTRKRGLNRAETIAQ